MFDRFVSNLFQPTVRKSVRRFAMLFSVLLTAGCCPLLGFPDILAPLSQVRMTTNMTAGIKVNTPKRISGPTFWWRLYFTNNSFTSTTWQHWHLHCTRGSGSYTFIASVPAFAPASREPAFSSTTIQDDREDIPSCPSNDAHFSIFDSDENDGSSSIIAKAPCKAHISGLACQRNCSFPFVQFPGIKHNFSLGLVTDFGKTHSVPNCIVLRVKYKKESWSKCFPYAHCILHLMLLCTSHEEFISVPWSLTYTTVSLVTAITFPLEDPLVDLSPPGYTIKQHPPPDRHPGCVSQNPVMIVTLLPQ